MPELGTGSVNAWSQAPGPPRLEAVGAVIKVNTPAGAPHLKPQQTT